MNKKNISGNKISLNPSVITRLLLAVSFSLVLASILIQLIVYVTGARSSFGLNYLFNVNNEQNIPAFFSSLLLLFSALLLLVIAILHRNRKESNVFKWALLSFIFLCLAFDEAFSFHEKVSRLIFKQIGDSLPGIFYSPWVIPGMITVFLFAVYFARFFFQLNARTRRTFLIAATIYVGSALGFELIEARHLQSGGSANWIYYILVYLEECLEMVGIIIFIHGLLIYISDSFNKVHFYFTPDRSHLPSDHKN